MGQKCVLYFARRRNLPGGKLPNKAEASFKMHREPSLGTVLAFRKGWGSITGKGMTVKYR
jgi:hypothetical protein